MERIYPTADFKDGLVIVYSEEDINGRKCLFYDRQSSKPVMDADMPSVFLHGVLDLEGAGFGRPQGYLYGGIIEAVPHNAIVVDTTRFIAGEFYSDEETSEDVSENS